VSNFSGICKVLGVCVVFIQACDVYSSERSLEADVNAVDEVNDNIFLTTLPHNTVNGVIITPSLSGIIKEENWETKLKARIKDYNYSDKDLDSTDQYFNLTGRYLADRNIFSLNVNHDLASSLNYTSDNFGIVARRVNTKKQSVSPQYTRLLTERLLVTLNYTYTDVGFFDAQNTGFTPYVTEMGAGSLSYDLTEKDKLTLSLTAVDYKSRDNLVTYRLFMSRMGIDHKFSKTFSTDFTVGVSRRSTTNLQTQSFNFFGQPIFITQEVDSKNRGLVLDLGLTRLFESGQVVGRISRDNTANSFGGLDQADKIKINYSNRLSALWRYAISGRYENYTSISSGSRSTDRKVFFFDMSTNYSINRNWKVNASYGYALRRFKSGVNDKETPLSNRVHIGLTYNFPSLSTF